MITLTAIGLFAVFLISRCFYGGPYVPSSFDSGTLLSSYWSVRPLTVKTMSKYDSRVDKEMVEVTERNRGVVLDIEHACPLKTDTDLLIYTPSSKTTRI